MGGVLLRGVFGVVTVGGVYLAWCVFDNGPPSFDVFFHILTEASAAHKDPARRKVGATAHTATQFRAMETERGDCTPLIKDPVAAELFSLSGAAALDSRVQCLCWRWRPATLIALRPLAPYSRSIRTCVAQMCDPRGVDHIALRTRKTSLIHLMLSSDAICYIDDVAARFAAGCGESGPCSVVSLGAGLDARACRMGSAAGGAAFFDVDFAGVSDVKRALAAGDGADTCGAERDVVCWVDDLIAAGFSPASPTLWVLDGLTNYFTADELDRVLRAAA
eukprot:gene4326-11490_t